MGIEIASSSSSLTPQWTYDVFLSFRGEDTRNGFTDHLYAALKQKGIVTFKDDEKLERGKSISPELLKAIEESRFAIVILSSNYASSTWCLDELAKINRCMKETRLTILPIFYHVNPSDVRNQTGTFAQVFDKYKNENIEKVQTWRVALKEVANLSGWHLQDGPESKLIQNIVGELWENLSYPYLKDVQDKVGIISRAEKLKLCLAIGLNDVRIIGVWGMGGIGKTTLVRVVFHMVSYKFESCCFLANVKEVSEKEGLVRLQERLILQIFNESMSIQDVCHGVSVIKNRLCHKKILLVLDDVNQLDQLNKLVGKHIWFGSGSRVIITTRDKHLLQTIGVDEIYEAKGLSNDESLHFLSLKAFKKDHPPEDYVNLSKDFVHYANGLPLAIEVLGSFLIGRSINQWKGTLNRLKQFPERNILKILKISLEGLHETEKEIFLNIACFFNHEDKDTVEEKLHVLGLYPEIGLRVLIDKSLIKLLGNQLWMHDLIQDMGRDIVRQEDPKDPGKRSRLHLYEDIDNVLTNNTGTEAVECIILNLSEPKRANWNPKAFSKMHDLKMLEISNIHLLHGPIFLPNSLRLLDWTNYPSKSLPSSFYPQKLVELRMADGKIQRLWKGVKHLDRLKLIQVNNSQNLIETPDITEIPNLERLVLENCINLHTVHPSIGLHKSLILLNLKGCVNLRTLPMKFEMESLEVLNLSGCSKLKKIPEFGENLQRVLKLYLDGTAITKLPTSIKHMTNLALLNLRDCKSLSCLPSTLFNLKLLKDVNISGCSKLERLPENMGNAESLEFLDVSGTAIRDMPSSIGLLKNLRVLSFQGCKGLSSFQSTFWYDLLPFYPRLIGSIPVGLSFLSSLCSLTNLNLSYCNLREVPNDIGSLPNDIGSLFLLEEIDLSGNNFVYLPESIIQLSNLEVIYLENCTSLLTLPMFPSKINYIWASNCTSLETLPDKLKPHDSFEPSLHLVNCLNLADNQGLIDLLFARLKALLQGLPHQYPWGRYNLVIPGSVIPRWFSHQSIGDEVSVQKKNSPLRNEWIGIAVCTLFCSNNHHPCDQIINLRELGCQLIANGNHIYPLPGISNIAEVLSDHIWLLYLFPQHYDRRSINLLWECDANGFNQIGIRIETKGSGLRVKKCGFRLVYMKDIEDLHRTMVQSVNNSECTSVSFGIQETHDGAGPSEEDSFNGISDCEESSEYEECGEEFSDSD